MKISRTQANLGVYDFLLSDEHNLSYNTIDSGSSKLHSGILKLKKEVHPSTIKLLHIAMGGEGGGVFLT